ncbi:putative membrane protein, partial [Clostridioides difficile DA00195]
WFSIEIFNFYVILFIKVGIKIKIHNQICIRGFK